MSAPVAAACAELRANAAGIASLRADDPERRAAWQHAEGCPACAEALEVGDALLTILDSGRELSGPSADVLARTSAAVLRDAGRRSVFDRPWLAPVAIAAAALLAWPMLVVGEAHALGRFSAGGALRPALEGALLALVAAGILVVERGRSRRALASLGALAVGLAVYDYVSGSSPRLYINCGSLEQLSAVLPLVAAGLLAYRQKRRADGPGGDGEQVSLPLAFATAAMGGAVVGLTALHLLCPFHTLEHLVVLHVGGVALAAAVGGALGLVASRLRWGVAA